MKTPFILALSALAFAVLASLSAQAETGPGAETGREESPWSLSGSIGHASSLAWTAGSGLGYGSATALSVGASFRSGGFSGRFSAEADLLTGTRAREIWLAAAASVDAAASAGADATGDSAYLSAGGILPDFLMIPGYIPGILPAGSSPDSLVVLKVDEFAIGYGGDRLRMSAGRMAVNFGQGLAFSPADIFAVFDRSGIMPRRKGVDVLEVSAFPLPLADLRFVAKPSARGLEAGSYATRSYIFLFDTVGVAFGAAWSGTEQAWTLSPEIRIDTGFASIYGEAAWHLPSAGSTSSQAVNAMAGFDTSVADTVFIAEYGYYGQETDPHRAFASISRALGDEGSLAASATWIPGSSIFTAALALTVPDVLGADLSAGLAATRIPGTEPSDLSGWKPGLTLSVLRKF